MSEQRVRTPCALCREERLVAGFVNYGPDHWLLGRPPGLQVLEPLCRECADLLTPDHIHVPLPGGGRAHVAPDCPPAVLEALARVEALALQAGSGAGRRRVMLVEDVEIPAMSIPVAVNLLGPPRLAGKVGIAWMDLSSDDPDDWILVIPGMPSIIRCHSQVLVPLPESARPRRGGGE